MFCYAKYRGGVRRTEGLENTDSGGNRFWPPLPLLIVDVIGEVTCRAGEVKETGKRCKIYHCVENGNYHFNLLSLLYCGIAGYFILLP